MDNKITLNSIVKTEKEIKQLGYGITNNIIEQVDVNTVGHFGDVTCLEIICEDICPMSGYNNTRNLGILIHSLVQLLGISNEDGLRLNKIKNIPCRLIFDDADCSWGSRCIGIGHFRKDKFVLIRDFATINEV